MGGPKSSTRGFVSCAIFVVSAVFALVGPVRSARTADASAPVTSLEIAVALPFTGEEAVYGRDTLEGIQLAIAEANAGGAGPHIDVKTYDDRSADDGAKEIAGQIAASKAAVVLGPSFSTASIAAGPVYAAAGLVSLPPTATADAITKAATTFRAIFKNSDQGGTLATYLARVLGGKQADVLVVDNGYGHSLQAGFQESAQQLGIDAKYLAFKTPDEADQAIAQIAADAAHPPIVFAMLDADAARLLMKLRRLGVHSPVLGGDALGDDIFAGRFADEPEEHRQRGFFTDGVYAVSPMILDSANADTLAFAERFNARFGHDPVWEAAAAYDAARLAVDAVRAATTGSGAARDVNAMRLAVQTYLVSLDSPKHAAPGLFGPLWFDKDRGRPQAIRIGTFNGGHFESAPTQIVPVTTADQAEIASGAVFAMGPLGYARLQRVVYTGVFINEIPRVDLTRSSFGADFYLWLRYAKDAGPGSADPTDINFPNLMGSGFDRAHPAEQGEMPDGTEYRLWRIQGEFRNDFDLHRFPFDQQTLALSFFNARAAADKIVYALDKRSPPGGRNGQLATDAAPIADKSAKMAAPSSAWSPAAWVLSFFNPFAFIGKTVGAPDKSAPVRQNGQPAADPPTASGAGGAAPLAGAPVAPGAFRNLSQWAPLGASERRENLVTESALGDLRHAGVESYRELSGFLCTITLARRTAATLAKTMLPLILMTMIMFASLFFPVALVKEKVTVAITGALSGAVLLTAINNQLGNVGYTIAVEYVFFLFFGLCLLCVVAALSAESLRAAKRGGAAVMTERATKVLFVCAVAATVATFALVFAR